MREIVREALGRNQDVVKLHNSTVFAKPPFHGREWGMATLEVVLAITESGRTHKQIELPHQIEVRDEYDIEYKVTPAKGQLVSI